MPTTKGNVQRFYGERSFPLDLKDFCFDQQMLPVKAASVRYAPDELMFALNEQLTGQRGGVFDRRLDS
jgi:hypothetical protein